MFPSHLVLNLAYVCVYIYFITMNSKINMGCFVRVCFIRIGCITRAICLSYKFSVVNVIKKE